MRSKPFTHRHVIITGGSQGIGAHLAQQLAAHGARLTLIARNADQLATTADPINATWAAADVSDPHQLDQAIAVATAANGPVHTAIACAGYAAPSLFTATPVDSFRRHLEVNYLGAVNLTQAVWPHMTSTGNGHLVYIASVAALLGVPGYTAYAPAKWAMRGFADSLRYEAAPHGIAVSVAYPPDTDTPGFATENQTKPPATIAVSGSRPANPARIATTILEGIAARRADIALDTNGRTLLRLGGLATPAIRRHITRQTRHHL